MTEDKDSKVEAQAENIEQVLRERERLDQLLKDKFSKRMAIVFSDISGFTKYMDTWGDIRGRAWVQKHHDMVFPLIESHGGKVLQVMGDGIMAAFTSPLPAVKAGVAIQRRLDEFNQKTPPADQIHVHIGINWGEILVDDDHIAGDVVNVASRIQSQATADQLLISKSVYDDVCGSEDILCRFHAAVAVKGKSVPLELYRIVWKDEDIVLSVQPRVRSQEPDQTGPAKEPVHELYLDVARVEDSLKISAHEQLAGEASTVRHYEEINAPMDKISARCGEIVKTLNSVNRRGLITRDVLSKLREIGQVFSDDLFTPNVKEMIRNSLSQHLILSLDDQLVQIPWELIHDGRRFLCQKFSMGRLVRTRQNVIGKASARALARPLKMLILADSKGDLEGANSEGTQIRDFIDGQKNLINATLRSDKITTDYIREKIRNFDLVHFAGHFDYDQKSNGESGWRLTDGSFNARDIIKMGGSLTMPALIFSNACQSARTDEWTIKEYFQDEVFGLANAFILSGVKHYVGTFWEILDEPSRYFSLEFYKHLLSGLSVGAAIQQSRLALIKEYGEETIAWASYLLYGDPTFNYLDHIREKPAAKEAAEPAAASVKGDAVRAAEEVIDVAAPVKKIKTRTWRAVAAGVVIALAVGLGGYLWKLKTDTTRYEAAALTYFNEGNFSEALKTCDAIEGRNSDVRLVYLIRGNIYLREGKLDPAEAAFQKALQASKGTAREQAGAFMGLGRIASLRKNPDAALKYYGQSVEAAPQSSQGYLSQALVLEEGGQYGNALKLMEKARTLSPDDRILAAAANETRQKAALTQDREKQDRVNKLVAELVEKMKTPSRAMPSDGWTSPPLTLWLMDFKVQGYSLQEAEDRLLINGLTDKLIEGGRIRVVERAVLDKLLEELKLGTSQLTDRSTALSLGKILAARLILTGGLVYAGPQTQVSLRLIETETGQISGTVTETFGSSVPASALVDKLSETLMDKLKKLYPLRGKILKISGNEITLNIGQPHGVSMGQKFKTDAGGVLEVISVQAESSIARVEKKESEFFAGERIQAL